jgi:hypothetical protein
VKAVTAIILKDKYKSAVAAIVLLNLYITVEHVLLNRISVAHVRFEVLTAVKMSILIFWVVTPRGRIRRYQRFEETFCLPSSILKEEAVCSSETLLPAYKSTRRYNPEDGRGQNKVIFIRV